jgi:hypothetical protein
LEAGNTPLIDVPPDPVDVTPPPDEDDIPEIPVKKPAPKKAADSDDNGEDWGIQPDLGF